MKRNRVHTRLLIAVLITTFALPMLNIAVISPLRTYFYSDITYPTAVGDIVSYLYTILSILSVYAGFACLAYALTARQLRLTVTILCGVSIPVQYGAIALVDVSIYGTSFMNQAYVLYSINSCLYELLRFGVMVLICMMLSAAARKKGRPCELTLLSLGGSLSRANCAVTIVTAGSMLLSNIIETLTLLFDIGAPVNMSETLTLVSPYIITAILAILGYFLVYLIMRMIHRASGNHN